MNAPSTPELEGQFRSAFRYAAIGMALVSLEGKFLSVNAALCDLLGYSEEELIALDFQSITHPDDLKSDLVYVQEMIERKLATYQMEKRYFHKSGSLIWVLLSVSMVTTAEGKPDYFISQIVDITERKSAALALQRSRELLGVFIKSVPAAVAMFDRGMRYLAYSDRWIRDYELENKEILGMTHYEVFPEILQHYPHWVKMHNACMLGKVTKVDVDTFKRANGRVDYLRYELLPWTNSDGEIGGILMMTELLTDKVRAQEAQYEANKLQSLEKMAGGMAHEINNALQPVMNYIGLAQSHAKKHSEDHKMKFYLDAIQDNAQSAIDIARDILLFSSGGIHETQEIVVQERIDGIIDFAQKLLPVTMTVKTELDLPEEPVRIEANITRFHQILLNLFKNSLDACGGKGEINVHAYCTKKDLHLYVSDNGPGVDKSIQDRIFEPFFSSKEAEVGTGMGLAVIRGILRSWGGEITYNSTYTGGAQFDIIIPVIKENT